MWTPLSIPLASQVWYTRSSSSAGEMWRSMFRALALSNSRRMWAAPNASTERCSRIPSHTPSPSRKLESRMLTLAHGRHTRWNLSVSPSRTPTSTSLLRSSASYTCVPPSFFFPAAAGPRGAAAVWASRHS